MPRIKSYKQKRKDCEYSKRYREKNKERIKKYSQERYSANHDRLVAYQAARRKTHKARIKAIQKKCYNKSREKYLELNRIWKEKNPERVALLQKRYDVEYHRKWRQNKARKDFIKMKEELNPSLKKGGSKFEEYIKIYDEKYSKKGKRK